MDVVALELLTRLRTSGSDFSFEVLIKSDEDGCLQSSEQLTVTTLPSAFYPWWEQWILPRFIANKPHQWLHCTGNTAPIWGKNPLVVTIHDLIFLEENYLFKKDGGSLYQRFGNVYRSLIVPTVARRAKQVITVSEFQRQLIIKKLRLAPSKVSVVYNGADERFFKPATVSEIETVGKKYGIEGFPYIFFIANTEPRKNTDGVINAFHQFCQQYPQHQHRLVIKGLTVEQLQKKIQVCGASDSASRIHRVGYIDYADLPLIYQGAEALWFPSFLEGFGLPIVEAMAGGTPVITSDASVMPEIAGDAALYINPYQPAMLVAQTIALLEDKTLRQSLVEKGKQRALQFTWGSSVQALLQTYELMMQDE